MIRKGGINLSKKQDSTQKYFRDIMPGRKQYIKCEDIFVAKVPQFKGLQVENLLIFAGIKINIDQYLSEYDYQRNETKNVSVVILILLSKSLISLSQKRLRRDRFI